MDLWTAGRQAVASTFFHDEISLYAVAYTDSQLGEELEQEVVVDDFPCNIENSSSIVSHNESGSGSPQSLRVSLPKDVPLSYNTIYKFKIKHARVAYDDNEWWRIDGWTEAQLSTVVTASREVSV